MVAATDEATATAGSASAYTEPTRASRARFTLISIRLVVEASRHRSSLPVFEAAFVAALPSISALGLIAELAGARGRGEGLVPMFSLSYEQNLPTWYASGLLLLCARALTEVASLEAATRRGFGALACGFAYLSIDEAVEIHEHAGSLYAGSGLLYFGWVVPAAAVLVLVLAISLPFLRRLPRPTRRAFVLAGIVYVGGAVGMELPLGVYTERYGSETFGYGLIDWVEESLELVGAAMFLVAIRRHERRLVSPR